MAKGKTTLAFSLLLTLILYYEKITITHDYVHLRIVRYSQCTKGIT